MFAEDYIVEEGVHYFSTQIAPTRSRYYDFEKKDFKNSTGSMTYGIVNFDPLSQKYQFGWWTPNMAKNANIVIGESTYPMFNKKYFKEINFIEIDPDVYVNPRHLVQKVGGKYILGMNPAYRIPIRNRKYSWNYQFPNNYGAKFLLEDFKSYHSKNYVPNREAIFNLPDLTFGVEFETASGSVPQTECARLGLIPLRDGSITGNEYATIPFKGKTGIGVLHETCEVLQQYCDIDHLCSLHVHVGVPKVDEKLVVAAYHYFKMLEPQILSMFPPLMTASSAFKKGDKDYCKKLPNGVTNPKESIKNQFDKLFEMYAETPGYSFTRFGENHPHDRDGNRKWEVHARYKWINLINLIFSGAKTIEFRIHTPSLNKNKVIPWVYICVSLVWYLLNHQDEIIEIAGKRNASLDLNTIISACFKDRTIVDYLISYISYRMKYVTQQEVCYNDKCGFLEILDDFAFQFNYKAIELVK